MYKICEMKKEDIPESVALWKGSYSRYCSPAFIPDFLSGGEKSITAYLENQIDHGNALVSKKNGVLTGYLAWMCLDFHRERSAFCPIIGHAAKEESCPAIYHGLYNYASQIWVEDDRFNHLWMIYNDNYILKDMLYDIGFGSHVMDAYAKVHKPVGQADGRYKITMAADGDAPALLGLVKESVPYYRRPPVFLRRSGYEREDLVEIIQTGHLFVAWDTNTPVGFMNLSVQTGYNIENLASPNTGLISKVGAYIKPEYRGMGIGTRLCDEVMKCCAEKGIPYVHVAYETANPFANLFWPKHFQPVIRSVRRTVNKDANIPAGA